MIDLVQELKNKGMDIGSLNPLLKGDDSQVDITFVKIADISLKSIENFLKEMCLEKGFKMSSESSCSFVAENGREIYSFVYSAIGENYRITLTKLM